MKALAAACLLAALVAGVLGYGMATMYAACLEREAWVRVGGR